MKEIKWKLELRKVSDLIEYHKNARSLSPKQAKDLKTSIKKFGLIDKPVINLDNTIIGGHQRLKVMEDLEEIEVYVPDRKLTDKQVEELNIRMNKNTGDWDWDILSSEWNAPDLLEWGFDETDKIFNEGIVEGIEYDESVIDNEILTVKFKLTIPLDKEQEFEKALNLFLGSFTYTKVEKIL